MSAAGRNDWELLLTYPIAPITGIVALALRNEVIHHGDPVSIAGYSGVVAEVLDGVQSRPTRQPSRRQSSSEKQLPRLPGLFFGLVVLRVRSATVASRCGSVK